MYFGTIDYDPAAKVEYSQASICRNYRFRLAGVHGKQDKYCTLVQWIMAGKIGNICASVGTQVHFCGIDLMPPQRYLWVDNAEGLSYQIELYK